jgi:glycogen operon protein
MFQLKIEYQPGNPERLGVNKTEKGFNFAVAAEAERIELCLYERESNTPVEVITLGEEYRFGNVFAVLVTQMDRDLFYNYRINGVVVLDPYAKSVHGAYEFGVKREKDFYMSPVAMPEFDWEGDRPLCIPYEDSVLYKLHVRGFTRHSSARVEKRGTFLGILEKLDYLKSLGITAVELMPVHEFEEVQKWTVSDKNSMYHPRFTGKVNYWGYTGGMYFAPKSAYATSAEADCTVELKQLIKQLHKNGIEVITEMFFEPDTDINLIRDCVRYWTTEYHLDGVHLLCNEAALRAVSEDPLLSRTKLFTTYWNGTGKWFGKRHLANYNNGFMNTARKFLKGDENMLGAFVEAVKENHDKVANVNYIAYNNGFTLMDLVSYDRKHNELNGENNRDGEDFNNSWNCGVEGPTRKKKILDLRIRQIKNALLMLLLSQGVPLVMSGDEFGNTQEGNNNPYCQDNEISYVNWKNTAYSREIFEFTKNLISFRKKHGIFHHNTPLRDMDYKACGYPDISYHGKNAWMADFENYVRNVGILYCGEYAQDDYIYVCYNMHWEEHSMALPMLPDGYGWHCAFDTSNSRLEEIVDQEGRQIAAKERSVVVLVGEKNA